MTLRRVPNNSLPSRDCDTMGARVMLRPVISTLLSLLFTLQALAQTGATTRPTVEETVRQLKPGAAVEVRFNDGSKVRGWAGDVTASGFVLSREKQGRLDKLQVSYDQVRSVKAAATGKPSHTARNILIGVGITVLAITTLTAIMVGG